MQVAIDDWHKFCKSFESFFQDIDGVVETMEKNITFRSPNNRVSTHLSVFNNGEFSAGMPLHGVDSKIKQVVFTGSEKKIQLLGENIDYTYRVPLELQTSD